MIKSKKVRWIITVIWVTFLIHCIAPSPVTATPLSQPYAEIISEVQNLVPMSIEMVDQAVSVLSNGFDDLSARELELLNSIADPGNKNEIDQVFIDEMLANYTKIHDRLENDLVIVYSGESEMCTGMRLFYTDFTRIYICPYYLEEESVERKAHVLIHEVAHMAMLVTDRPYYDPKSYSSVYNALTPRGSWVTEIPVIGHIVREIAHNDTLYSPDTYAWFAAEV